MKAAVYHGRHDLRVEDVPTPAPGPGELLLEVHSVGVCGTDAAEWEHGPFIYAVPGPHAVTGHAGPLIPGHELSGRVVALGDGVRGIEVGAIVACGAGYTVGTDVEVRRGRPNLSSHYATVGLQRNGGLAQYVAVPAEACIDVRPYGLRDDAAALAQPMAIAVHSMRRGRLTSGEKALVIGAGGIGAFLLYAAVELGAQVGVVDLSDERLEVARSLGAHELIGAADGDLGDVLAARDFRPDAIYEVSGSAVGLGTAIRVAPNGSRVVMVGIHEHTREVDVRRITLGEIDLLGTNAHVCDVDLPEAVRVLATRTGGWADVAPKAFPLELLLDEGIRPIVERRAKRIKTLIDPWADAPRETETAPDLAVEPAS
jgi:(R,R)-butanediol dehydrogenase/meso-butanediol dehydrogenase/diacetyl reductase